MQMRDTAIHKPIQFSSVPWLSGSSEGHEVQFSRDPPPVFSAKGSCGQFWYGQGFPLFDGVKHFLYKPWHCPPSDMPWRMVLERVSWHVTCPNHANFRPLIVARRCSCGPTRKLSCSAPTHWYCASSKRYKELSSCTWFWKPGPFF